MNVMELMAKIGLDTKEYDDGLEKAGGKFSKFGSLVKSGGKALGGAIGSVASTTLKATGAMIGSATAGVVALTKSAYSAYADYEQLVGGVETLFGDASTKVMEYANEAYKTAGLSANDYMETVTGMSASLIQSLGGDTEKASELANKAIIDMSDNANKMGSDIESIQNAYAGFAKGNFTMLDNLKLGYGGTAKEMQRLLQDAEAISGIKYDVSSYADIVEAIHVVQTEMEITGTTAKEASSTLSGSFATMQGAWQNLVANLANPDANLGENINALVESAKTLITNAIPVISQALSGIGQAVAEIIPVIASELPPLIEELLPTILDSATNLVQELASQLPSMLNVLVQQIPLILPALIETTISVLVSIADALVNALPIITDTINSNISVISSGISKILSSVGELLLNLLPSLLPSVLEIAVQLITELATGLSQNADMVIQTIFELVDIIVTELTNPDTLMTILECGLQIVFALAEGLLNNLPMLLGTVGKLIENIVIFIGKAIPELVVQIGKFGAKLITDILPQLIITASEKLAELIANIVQWIVGWIPSILSTATEVFKSIGQGVMDASAWIWEKVSGLAMDILDWIVDGLKDIGNIGINLVKGLWEGIKGMGKWLWDKLSGWAGDILSDIGDFFGIASPSKKTHYFGEMVTEGLVSGIEKRTKESLGRVRKAYNSILNAFSPNGNSTPTNDAVGSVMDMFWGNKEQPKADPKAVEIQAKRIAMNNFGANAISETITGTLADWTKDIVAESSKDYVSSYGGGGSYGGGDSSSGGSGSSGDFDKIIEILNEMSETIKEGSNVTVPVYIGNKQIDEVYVDSSQRLVVRSGGQVYV